MRPRLPLFPLLLPLYPVLFFYSRNTDQLQPRDLTVALVVVTAALALAWAAVSRPYRDAAKGGTLVAVVGFCFFSYGHATRVAYRLLAGPGATGSQVALAETLVFTLFLAAVALVAFVLARTGPLPKRLLVVGDVVTLVLVALPIMAIAGAALGPSTSISGRHGGAPGSSPDASVLPTADLPNIVYIIPDGYGRADVLQDLYGFDNSPFIERLESRGFRVPARSRSNYTRTVHSLASTLNMDYVQALLKAPPPASNEVRPLVELIESNRVVGFLRRRGYRVIANPIASPPAILEGAESTGRVPVPPASLFAELVAMSPLPTVLGMTSPLLAEVEGAGLDPRALERAAWSGLIAGGSPDLLREATVAALDGLGRVSDTQQPLFEIAYVLCPHPPFVFGPDGERTEALRVILSDGSHYYDDGGTREEYLRGYPGQLAYLNRLLEETIERLDASHTRPTVIIIQSDHGPGAFFDQEDPRKSDLHERLSSFLAVRLPGPDASGIAPDISAVNTFRVVLNAVFDAGLAPLPDHQYYAPYARPYELVPVTP